MDSETRKKRLATVSQLVAHAAQMAQQGDRSGASRRLDEATVALQPLGDDEGPDRLEVLASIHEGKGQLAIAGGDANEAYLQLSQSIRVRERQAKLTGEPRLLHLGIAHLNLSSACTQLGRNEEALAENRRALEAFDGFAPAQAGFMKVAALQAQGLLLARMRRPDEAITTYERAIALGEALQAEDVPDIPEMLSQIRISASVTCHQIGRNAQARAIGREAADEAWDRFEVTGADRAAQQYLTAQMNLVTFCEHGGDFAGAEDALFKVLKLVGPQAEVLARGRALYVELLKKDDAELEAGNLPRDEVEESLAELDAMVAAAAQA
ncbi:MAG: hypothetical protein EP329_27170 [Deltaproteobacteria bacterium]|nr:MAG: hypothetical protein EP329_27170 [Deltaproteobacteria bacterium]